MGKQRSRQLQDGRGTSWRILYYFGIRLKENP